MHCACRCSAKQYFQNCLHDLEHWVLVPNHFILPTNRKYSKTNRNKFLVFNYFEDLDSGNQTQSTLATKTETFLSV